MIGYELMLICLLVGAILGLLPYIYKKLKL